MTQHGTVALSFIQFHCTVGYPPIHPRIYTMYVCMYAAPLRHCCRRLRRHCATAAGGVGGIGCTAVQARPPPTPPRTRRPPPPAPARCCIHHHLLAHSTHHFSCCRAHWARKSPPLPRVRPVGRFRPSGRLAMARLKGDSRYYQPEKPNKHGFEPVCTKVFASGDGYDLWIGGRRGAHYPPAIGLRTCSRDWAFLATGSGQEAP